MHRSLHYLWFLTAILLGFSPCARVAAQSSIDPASEVGAEAEPPEESPLAPLFGDPPLATGETDTDSEGVAEIGTVEPVNYDEPAETEQPAEEDEGAVGGTSEDAEHEPLVAQPEAVDQESAPAEQNPSAANVGAATTEKPAEHEVETATFNGIRPGEATMDEVHAAWGKPSQTFEDHGTVHQLFAVEPFKEIDVSYSGRTVAAIVIFMEQAFAAPDLAEQLGLDNLQAVIIPDGKGRWLGQAYPERGVMFGFDPERYQEKQVAQIVLEPVSGLPFLLRAEVRMQRDYAQALADLDHAVRLEPKLARAHALRGEILLAMMRWDESAQALDAAIALEEKSLEFRLLKAGHLRQTGDYPGAVEQARQVIAGAEGKPLAKATALVTLAQCVSEGPDRDFRRAADYALEAIKLTEALTKSKQPRSRRAARVVALDAHLELANAIAWGFWRQKNETVPKWLSRAQKLADQLATEDKAGEEYRLRVASKALAACVGLKGGMDPAPWVKSLQQAGGEYMIAVNDPIRHRQLEWQVGLALYDAMQAFQQLDAHKQATEVGTLAAAALEHVNTERQPLPGDAYLLGRLYFRLGTQQVADEAGHDKAIAWFDKARPLIEKPLPVASRADVGRQGETMVSMAVSYWSAGQQDLAVSLTEAGAKLMEQGVEIGGLDQAALQVPYNNLATMHGYLGDDDAAAKYTQLAEKSTGAKLK